jgi:hypothetical protein
VAASQLTFKKVLNNILGKEEISKIENGSNGYLGRKIKFEWFLGARVTFGSFSDLCDMRFENFGIF